MCRRATCAAIRSAPALQIRRVQAERADHGARNPDYWKPGRPHLDGIEYTIIRDRSTAALAFISGKFDMTFPNDLTVPLQKNIESQMPDAICKLTPQGGQNRNLLVNRDKPPFDSPDLRH